MSMANKLHAEKRDDHGKGAARKLRAGGRVPAVLYGKGTETLALSLDAHEAEHLFQSISVENTIVDLDILGEKAPVPTLVREVQVHPYKPGLLHVDFLIIRKGVKLELEIPVHLVGIPDGVKNSGGILQQGIHELRVKCLPTEIPESIEIDVSGLALGDSIHVSDVTFAESIEVLVEADRTICSVVAPKGVAEPVAVEEVEPGLEGAPPAEEGEEG